MLTWLVNKLFFFSTLQVYFLLSFIKRSHLHFSFSSAHRLHPSMFSITAHPALRVAGGCSLSQLSQGEGGVHPAQIERQTSIRTHIHIYGPTLESPMNLTCISLDGGRKPKEPDGTDTGKLHIEKQPFNNGEPGLPESFRSLSLQGRKCHLTFPTQIDSSSELMDA